MQEPAIPKDEAERLAALRAYQVLDTEEEPAFDTLTQLAAEVLEVPIALISLVDADRQWFKSHHGLEGRETPRNISFCGHVVADHALLIVPDAHADPRFSDNPLVTGTTRVAFYAGVPLRSPDGHVLGALCAMDRVPRTLTARQLAQLELIARATMDQLEAYRRRKALAHQKAEALENTRRMQVLFDAMAEGVVVQEPDGVITSCNPAAERILGLSRDQLSGRSSLDPRWRAIREDGSPFPGDQHPSMVALRTGEAQLNVLMGVHKTTGEVTWIRINALPLRDPEETRPHGAITTFHDVTEVLSAQAGAERLLRQEQLITTGTLAAGVGHEINTPLAYVLANLEYTIEELQGVPRAEAPAQLPELLKVLEETRDGAERISKIVRGLRAMAKASSPPKAIQPGEVFEIALQMAVHETKHKATLVVQLAQTPPVLADEPRLAQVLVNLLINAAQAFPSEAPERNRIRLSTALRPDGRVEIAVSDNGPGIPFELQRRVFDPFFTTKPIGQNTGLGLSISQSIALGLGGELRLESTPGEGSTFRLVLPPATPD